MSLSPRHSGLLLAAPLALALTGCGAGMEAQTYQERTVADSANVSVGALDLRNVSVVAPSSGNSYPAGSDAYAVVTIVSQTTESDTLLSVTSPAAGEVVLLQDGKPAEIEVPALGSTMNGARLVLRGLVDELTTGQYVPMTFRFERAGTLEVNVPVAVTGRNDRPVFTGEPGSEEGEPALGGPAGGHGEEAGASEEAGAGEEAGAEGSAGKGETEQGASEAEPTEAGADSPAEGEAGEADSGLQPEPGTTPVG